MITHYYLDMYFGGEKSSLISEIIKLQDFDLVIFLEPDVPWVDDGWRFAGEADVRTRNNDLLKKMFKEKGIPFASISGNYRERFDRARELVGGLFEESKR